MQIYEYILIGLAVGNMVAMLFGLYKVFSDPDIKADKQLGINKATCEEKHKRIDEIIIEIRKSVEGINYNFAHFKENEFRHIEDEMKKMNDLQIKILTVLEYRDGQKIK